VWIGRPAVIANATNTVAIWPGSFAGVIGFRDDIAKLQRWLFWLMIPSLLGGAAGAVILLHTSARTFARIVPLLILGATVLLAAQDLLTRRFTMWGGFSNPPGSPSPAGGRVREPAPHRLVLVFIFQFLVGVYGGYFGAGMGILMLAALGLIGLADLHQMNGLKNLLAICINGVAAIYFIVKGAVMWRDVMIMAVASIIGGFAGARLAHYFGRTFVRRAVVTIGLVMTVALFFKGSS